MTNSSILKPGQVYRWFTYVYYVTEVDYANDCLTFVLFYDGGEPPSLKRITSTRTTKLSEFIVVKALQPITDLKKINLIKMLSV